jgi:hypothetical protein
MFKNLIMPAFISLAMVPALASSATVSELEERIIKLEEEAMIATESLYDLSTRDDSFMEISGYADVEYIVDSRDTKNNSFRMHHMNFIFKKNLGSNWHFFSELEFEDAPLYEGEGHHLFEAPVWVDENDDGIVDPGEMIEVESASVHDAKGKIYVESVNLTYQWRQEANIRFGRVLTPVGIWIVDHYTSNVPTQNKPQIVSHIFPRTVEGAQVFGTVPMGTTFLNYDLFTGNGRGENPGHHDSNDSKAVGARLSFVFPALDHFELGVSRYSDAKDEHHGVEQEFVGDAFHGRIVYGPATLQFEQMAATEDSVTDHKGYYAQLLYDWEKYTFGVRTDFMDEEATNSATESSVSINSLFFNYKVNSAVTLKLEHHMVDIEDQAEEDFNQTLFSVVGYLGN